MGIITPATGNGAYRHNHRRGRGYSEPVDLVRAACLFAEINTYEYGMLNLLVPRIMSADLQAMALALDAAYLLFRHHFGLPMVLILTVTAGAALSVFA